MKTEIEHCRHFDAEKCEVKDTCPVLMEIIKSGGTKYVLRHFEISCTKRNGACKYYEG